MPVRDERGFGLIELLVAIAVFALLFLMVDGVFITAHRGARKAELGANVQQNGRVAMERLTREIRETDRADIRFAGDGSWVAFKSARPASDGRIFCVNVPTASDPLYRSACNYYGGPPAPSPQSPASYGPVWQGWVVYTYNAGTDELLREVQSPLTTDPVAPGTGEIVATSVRAFNARCSSGSAMLGNTVCVSLEVEGREVVQGSEVAPEQIRLLSRVEIRN
jgi:prepilin-type N-terminal cleavage/methylation domain-containing protein